METALENYHEIFRAIPMPCVLLTGSDFRILNSNEAFSKITGFSTEAAIGKAVNEVFEGFGAVGTSEQDTLRDSLTRLKNTKEKQQIKVLKQACPATGKDTYWNLQIIPQMDSLGNLISILIYLEDIQELTLLEKERDELQVDHQAASLQKGEAELAGSGKGQELKLSEAKFRALVQEGTDLIGILNYTGTYTFASESSRRIFGLPPEAFVGTNAFECIHPEDKDKVQKVFYSLKPGENRRLPNYRAQDATGKWRWIESIAVNLMEEPAVRGIVTHSRDITTLVEQAKEIEQITERYQLAATATQDLIYDWDLVHDITVRYHKSVTELYGYSVQEVDEHNFWRSKIHPNDIEADQKIFEQVLADKTENFKKTEYRFKRADGSFARVVDKAYIIRDEAGKAIRLVGAVTDISEITEQKEALKQSNNRYKMAMKVSNEMIYDWDIIGDIVDRGSDFQRTYGFESSEATANHHFWFEQIVTGDQARTKATLEKALTEKQQFEWKEEYGILKANGEIAHVLDRAVIIKDEEGTPLRLVGAVQDVSASRKMIRDIKKQNEALKEIAWEQSHVVRAPLVRLKGLLDFLEQEQFEVMSKEEVLGHIHTTANELDDIVRRIVKKTEEVVF